MKNIGYHLSSIPALRDNLAYLDAYGYKPNTFQLSIKFARSLTTSMVREIRALTAQGFKFYIHAPFTLNLVREPLAHRSFLDLMIILDGAQRCDAEGVVLHPGYLGTKLIPPVSEENAIETLLYYLSEIPYGYPELLLENCPGSVTGNMFGTIEQFRKICHRLPTKVNFCIDTCHAYANGEYFLNGVRDLKDYVSLIHLNSIEQSVKFGNFKDRHSLATFDDVNDGQFLNDIITLVREFSDIPMIMEKKGEETVRFEYDFLSGNV